MPTLEDHEERITRTERILDRLSVYVDGLADRNDRLDSALATLIEAQIKTEERWRETDKRFAETDKRFAETNKRFAETDKRFAETDERIAKLVSAIGEFIRIQTATR